MKDVIEDSKVVFGPNEVKNILRTKTNEEVTPLMCSTQNKDMQAFWLLIDLVESIEKADVLLEKDIKGRNTLYWASRYRNKEEFKLVLKVYEEKLGTEKVKQIFTEENEKGENILDFVAKGSRRKEKFETLFSFLEDQLDDEVLKGMLTKKAAFDYLLSFYFQTPDESSELPIFGPLITRTCTDNKSVETFLTWRLVAEFFPCTFLQQLLVDVERNREFSEEFYKELFRFQDSEGRNVLLCAKKNQDPGVFQLLEEKATEFLSREDIESQLLEEDSDSSLSLDQDEDETTCSG